MQLQSVSRNKADILQDLRAKMLAECEPDIQETFASLHSCLRTQGHEYHP
jgi:hypothetical protein